MRAFLLAAGLGTRLRPLTDSTPKCMVEIAGQPLLEIWLDNLERAGVEQVLVNLHYLPDVVVDYLRTRSSGPRVRTFLEPQLLGSAGTLLANRDWVEDEEAFLVCYADNLTDFDLQRLVETHRSSSALATIAVFRTDRPSMCGIVSTDANGLVTSFVEKPEHPSSDLANAGMYVFAPQVLDLLAGPPPKDIGFDLLPKLVGTAQTVLVNGYLRDIGTRDAYDKAQQEWLTRALG